MANILDVSRYIVEKLGSVSKWKLQKLCYYAQGWTLAWTDKKLFKEDFKAWSNGPVNLKLEAACKEYKITKENFPYGDTNNLTEDEKDSINRVIEEYGKFEPYILREMTREEKPFLKAKGLTLKNEDTNVTITKKSIKKYFKGLLKKC